MALTIAQFGAKAVGMKEFEICLTFVISRSVSGVLPVREHSANNLGFPSCPTDGATTPDRDDDADTN
jgi:hypothetical protein